MRLRPAIVLLSVSCSSFEASPDAADAGPADAAAVDGRADGGTPGTTKRIFVSFSRIRSGGGAGPMQRRADDLCNADAMLAGVGGNYVAWLSTPNAAAIDVLLPANGPWSLPGPDGPRVFADRQAVFQTKLDHEIDRHPDGTQAAPTVEVWTGTEADGARSFNMCDGWSASTAGADRGMIGRPAFEKSDKWTSFGTNTCELEYALVCFEK